jgi:hypothetical protein
MARIYTTGFELNHLGTSSTEGLTLFGTGASIVNTTVRTGVYSMKHVPTSGVASCLILPTFSYAGQIFLRTYVRFASLPSSGNTRHVLEIYGTQSCVSRVKNCGNGTLQMGGH